MNTIVTITFHPCIDANVSVPDTSLCRLADEASLSPLAASIDSAASKSVLSCP